jgi:hypothetical protein
MALPHILFHSLCVKRHKLSKQQWWTQEMLLNTGANRQKIVENLALRKNRAERFFPLESKALMLRKGLANNFVHKICGEPRENPLQGQPSILPHF